MEVEKRKQSNEACQGGRQLKKPKKRNTKDELEMLGKDYAELLSKHPSFWGERRSMSLCLKQLEDDISNLEKQVAHQQVQLECFTQNPCFEQLLVEYDCLSLELALLENEQAVLNPNAVWDDWMSEKVKLASEIKELELGNEILKRKAELLEGKGALINEV